MLRRQPRTPPQLAAVPTGPAARARSETPVSAQSLRALLGLVLKACPAKGTGAKVFFDVEPSGQRVIAAHDAYRCHIGYFPMGADVAFEGGVERASVRKLYRLLGSIDELEESLATIDEDGRVRIERPGQPALHHQLALVASILDWRPPSDAGADDLSIALTLNAEHLRDATRLKDATLTTRNRSSARVIVNAELDGDVVFRAIIAEYGSLLYDPDARQGKLPGVSR